MKDPCFWILQEDNDPSHCTKGQDNVAENLRQMSWIAVIIHPGQSPDPNPIEGILLVLKQCAKRHVLYPEKGEEKWDGSQKHLKSVLQEVRDGNTLEGIRERIGEMPERCRELASNGGEKMRSKKW
jgi:hypothetical protein